MEKKLELATVPDRVSLHKWCRHVRESRFDTEDQELLDKLIGRQLRYYE